jgi:hypothetical protein
MFSIPRTNVIESDTGFSVEVLGRTGLRYREGDRVMHVDSEVQMGPSGMIVGASSIRRWDPPYAAEKGHTDVSEWPCHVHVCLPKEGGTWDRGPYRIADWGLIERSGDTEGQQ